MAKPPKKPKGKTLLKKASDEYLDMGSFLMGKDLIGGLSGSEAQSFIDYLKSKGISENRANYMDLNSVQSHYNKFKGKMN